MIFVRVACVCVCVCDIVCYALPIWFAYTLASKETDVENEIYPAIEWEELKNTTHSRSGKKVLCLCVCNIIHIFIYWGYIHIQ